MGIFPPLLLMISCELSKGRQAMQLRLVNRQGRPSFAERGTLVRLTTIGDDRQPFEQG